MCGSGRTSWLSARCRLLPRRRGLWHSRSVAKRLVYKRKDDKWAWNLTVNGEVVATDGGQGYENESDARSMADRIINGEFSDADRKRRDTPPPGS